MVTELAASINDKPATGYTAPTQSTTSEITDSPIDRSTSAITGYSPALRLEIPTRLIEI